ncbi:MAG: iron-sulfur cluster repair di-iron protein [Verrucomicrobia bacterium]|nr:iron-sulfur cluster repair di-iron protein [Verrucomicrobiota bacterium]
MTQSLFRPTTTVGSIVAAQPGLAGFFHRAGIDYCCGGKRTLAEACAAKGLDFTAFLTRLEVAAAEADGAPEIDAAAMSLTTLADHIEQTHHRYLKEELITLVEMADRVAGKHGWRDERLVPIAETMRSLAEEMYSHMAKEEQILFPLVRELERAGSVAGSHCGSLANPIRQMESEHDGAGAAVARLRELTDAFTPDADACNTHRAMLAGFARLETDLHQHVHKENNVLFPRALALEARAVA